MVFVSEELSVFFGKNVTINCNVKIGISEKQKIVINTVRSKMLVRLPKFGHFHAAIFEKPTISTSCQRKTYFFKFFLSLNWAKFEKKN